MKNEDPMDVVERYFDWCKPVRREEFHMTLMYMKELFIGEEGHETTIMKFTGLEQKGEVEHLL